MKIGQQIQFDQVWFPLDDFLEEVAMDVVDVLYPVIHFFADPDEVDSVLKDGIEERIYNESKKGI